jgi:hypothetical protein
MIRGTREEIWPRPALQTNLQRGWTLPLDLNENWTSCRRSCPRAAPDSPSSEPARARIVPSCRSCGLPCPCLWAHVKFMRELRAERALLVAERYVHGEESFPYSITLLIATLLLLLGLVAIIDMAFRSGPLS